MTDRVVVTQLRSQFPVGLLGVPLEEICLSWRSNAQQQAYQLRILAADAGWEEYPEVESAESIGIVAPGGALGSREIRSYGVRIRSEGGWSDWSDTLRIEAGIPGAELDAQLIGIPSATEGPVPHLRTEFEVGTDLKRAVLRVSGHGVIETWLNGSRTDDEHLSPGWTAYQSRITMASYDVTHLLREGSNALGAVVADGWYRGRFGWTGRSDLYGSRIGVICQLEIESSDGSVTLVTSDAGWRGGFGPIQLASIYDGATIDYQRDIPGFSQPGFDDAEWGAVEVLATDRSRFEPRRSEPIRTIDVLPMSVQPGAERIVLDSGQNLSGWVRLEVEGDAGEIVTVRHAEVLEPSGQLHTAALRAAKATDTYILSGGRQILEPRFTFHGFRYADVVTTARIIGAHAVAISSDLPQRSTFSCSDATLTQFHSNVYWSQRGNFLSVPTDCPQRDERLGWTGDAQAFAPTANTLLDSEAFWLSWLKDLEIEQSDEGGVASIVPNIIGPDDLVFGGEAVDSMGRAGWADAATIVPWSIYESYGDPLVLRRQLDSMRRWVAHLRRRTGAELLLPREPFQYGDWLDPDAPAGRPWEGKTSSDFVANAFYVRSMRILADTEQLVGDAARAEELGSYADQVAAATWERFGEAAAATQTGAALLLEFELCPPSQRQRVAAGLAAEVRRSDGRIQTGFLGTPLVLFALSHNGYASEAYQMLLRREAPSWLYQVEQGATTVWERWDAIREDGSIHGGEMDLTDGEGSMLSFNHYAYGAMIDWVYRNVAGISPVPEQPGYRRVIVAPLPVHGIEWAEASIETRLGELSIGWRLVEDRFELDVEIPHGATAELKLPITPESRVEGAGGDELGPGAHRIVVHHPRVVSAPGQDGV